MHVRRIPMGHTCSSGRFDFVQSNPLHVRRTPTWALSTCRWVDGIKTITVTTITQPPKTKKPHWRFVSPVYHELVLGGREGLAGHAVRAHTVRRRRAGCNLDGPTVTVNYVGGEPGCVSVMPPLPLCAPCHTRGAGWRVAGAQKFLHVQCRRRRRRRWRRGWRWRWRWRVILDES